VKLLDKAAKLAFSGDKTKNHLLAAIAKRKDGAIVASKNGKTKTPRPTAHAEVRALKKAGHGSTLYVAKVHKITGEWRLSKPCNSCMTRIRNMKVSRVYYTVGPGEYGVIKL
jgi:tRNA(Arg) A34 adenosine deaminase TadA